jgi:FkbM family methyltransferase
MQSLAKLRHYVCVVRDYVRIFGPAGLAYLAEAVIVRRRRLVRVRSSWAPHPILLRLATSDIEVFRQVFLEQEYNISLEIKGPVRTIVDAGANIGLTSAFFAIRHPDAMIVAIEPEQGNYELLTANCKSYPNVRCIHGAIWGSDGPLRIRPDDARDCGFSVEPACDGDGWFQGYRVATLLENIGIDTLSVLKMDIEGSEIEVFKDSRAWSGRVENIIVELHDRKRPGCTEAFHDAIQDFVVQAKTRELTLAVRIQR